MTDTPTVRECARCGIEYTRAHGHHASPICADCRSVLTRDERQLWAPPNARKPRELPTHCGKGHEFTPENTIWAAYRNSRICRQCKRESNRRYVERTRHPQAA